MLLVDRPLRDARVSLAMYRSYRYWRARGLVEPKAAWRSIQTGVYRHRAYGSRSSFWPGPAAITAADMVANLDKPILLRLATVFTSTKCINTDEAMAALSMWPGAGSYHAYDTLRALRAVMNLQLRGEKGAAFGMSSNVSMFGHLLSLRDVLAMVRPRCSSSAGGVHAGDAALILRETKKALVTMGLLTPAMQYTKHELNSVLASPRAARLLFALQSLNPLSEKVLQTDHGKRHLERKQLDTCFPTARAAWDRNPHYAVGSEHLAGRFMPALRRRGWKP